MMNHKQHTPILQVLPQPNRLDAVLDMLDELHTAASEGDLSTTAGMSEKEVLGWLREVIYTARETIAEIEQRQERETTPMPRLLVLEKAQ